MYPTRHTLLARIKNPNDHDAWREFQELYPPMIFRYGRARGLGRSDAEEVRDQAMLIVARKIRSFEYDRRRGGFKNWLYRIASGLVIDLLRKRRVRQADTEVLRLIESGAPAPDSVWERQWRDEHLRYCVAAVRNQVSELNYTVFCMLVFDGCRVEDICQTLNLSANQVYKAKSLVLRRVREKLRELDSEDLE